MAINEKLVAPTPFKYAIQVKCQLKLIGQNWPLNFN